MALQTIDDRSLIEGLFEIFRSRGYEGATIALLSEVTGLKKSSLYHRFPAGKDDMVKAVVLHISAQVHEHLIKPLLDSTVTPGNRFNNMIAVLIKFYDDGKKNCLLNVLSLGDAKTEINSLLHNVYKAWLAALIKLGKETGLSPQEAESRSAHFLIVVEGALVVQRLTHQKQTFKNSLEYEKQLFFR